MTREIKFRAWDKDREEMIDWEPVHFEEDRLWSWEDVNNQDTLIFMQYTGLKDKNGKEIYEGDVVKNRYGVCWEVCWFEPKYQWRFRRGQNTFTLTDKQFWSCSQNKRNKVSAEVIGNIYENPELLEAKE